MISKELLKNVLNVRVKEIYKLKSNPNLDEFTLPYSIQGIGELYWINIFQLMYLCKQWAWEHNYQIISSYKSVVMGKVPYAELVYTVPLEDVDKYVMVASFGGDEDETEVDVVIKCCEWILKAVIIEEMRENNG